MACSNCRQSKVRCDSAGDGKSCSRCNRLQSKCETVAGFRRVSRVQKVAELERQVQHLATIVAQQHSERTTTPAAADRPTSLPAPTPQLLSATSVRSEPPNGPSPQSLLTSLPAPAIARSIEGIEISSERIHSFFQTFFTFYHPFLPFLDPSFSADAYYALSQPLFWAIIAVAAQRDQTTPSIITSIAPHVVNLAWNTCMSPSPPTCANIQALLLLNLWPYWPYRPWKEHAYLFANVAINCAIRIGLHRPGNPGDFRRMGNEVIGGADFGERLRTWVACNIVGELVASDLGHPPLTSLFDWTVQRVCTPASPEASLIPRDIRHMLLIMRFSNRVSKTMFSNLADPFGFPCETEWPALMNLLEDEAHNLEATLKEEPLSHWTRIIFHSARLYLHAFSLLSPPSSPRRTEALLKAHAAAAQYISTGITMTTDSNPMIEPMLCAPMTVLRRASVASCILLRVHSSKLERYVDATAGELFNTASQIVRRCSFKSGDDLTRHVDMVAQLWRKRIPSSTEANGESPVGRRLAQYDDEDIVMRVRGRGAVSVMFDCLALWRDDIREQQRTSEVAQLPTEPREDYIATGASTSDMETAEQLLSMGSTAAHANTVGMVGMDDWLWDLDFDFGFGDFTNMAHNGGSL
ncbi:hypothetical protein SAICODRAFT_70036 [Saitoella complicata NRRL Y-17804]|uniref:Zn(2)-C6 fungal-type domain-containing protein n=1 Tax=Saitoella complicata (strain BCRC 22490 / CBS 7301 / JCM 7358 / NBRC 10748 / NRRL Y-17804) TaxID=698492 RepID=A0A0E9NL04_SAICN|nr:uncharacterized protein SAICODRAFT_70036 [Saitoella complicata NRRL Y-17804]ODQ54868.1 hypothetical protein SAICODRAFT_70036 [Saitoella complicata NRRL Y-17804]GAO50524.1 hypothetical protein G7K_4648-t1 [Saitoella complicata NRRL Y-17804]